MSENIKTSVRTLLAGLVDYAGLFPPAGLSMEAAVQNYAKYHNGDLNWMLGRFIVPAGRLDEFAAHAKDAKTNDVWKLSVLDGGDLLDTIRRQRGGYRTRRRNYARLSDAVF